MSLDTSIGTATSESYASVAEADAYLLNRGDTSTWTALTTTQKEQKLKWAAVILDTLTFTGLPVNPYVQALEWPRAWVMDKNGFYLNSATIPTDVKNAQIELAFQLIANDWTQGLGPTVPGKVKVGSIELEHLAAKAFPAFVTAILRPYLSSTPGGGDVVRA